MTWTLASTALRLDGHRRCRRRRAVTLARSIEAKNEPLVKLAGHLEGRPVPDGGHRAGRVEHGRVRRWIEHLDGYLARPGPLVARQRHAGVQHGREHRRAPASAASCRRTKSGSRLTRRCSPEPGSGRLPAAPAWRGLGPAWARDPHHRRGPSAATVRSGGLREPSGRGCVAGAAPRRLPRTRRERGCSAIRSLLGRSSDTSAVRSRSSSRSRSIRPRWTRLDGAGLLADHDGHRVGLLGDADGRAMARAVALAAWPAISDSGSTAPAARMLPPG